MAKSAWRRAGKIVLKEGLAAIFDPVSEIEAGDVLLLRMTKSGPAGHLAIALGNDRAVHAQIGPNNWVKEATLRSLFAFCPLVSVWRWRDGC